MADRKISDLTALTTPASGDYLPIVDISEAAAASKNKRVTVQSLFQGIPVNVGIGTSSPGYALDVASSVAQVGAFTDAFIQYKSTAGNWHVGANSSNAYTFYSGTYGTGTERLRLDSAGRLLVGTSTGSALLQVHGQIAIGNGQKGTTSGNQGGGAVKTTAWSASGSSHTFTMSSYSPGEDNFSGLVVISGALKNTTGGKSATIIGVVNKRYGTQIVFTEISNTKNNMTTFSCTTNVNDLVVSTDADCNVCISFIGGY